MRAEINHSREFILVVFYIYEVLILVNSSNARGGGGGGFYQADIACTTQVRSAVRCSARRMKRECILLPSEPLVSGLGHLLCVLSCVWTSGARGGYVRPVHSGYRMRLASTTKMSRLQPTLLSQYGHTYMYRSTAVTL